MPDTVTTTTTTTNTTTEVLPVRKGLPIAAGILGTAALWLGGVGFHHGAVEDTLRNRATTVLAAEGLPGLTVDLSGRDATLSGVVPTEADIQRAHDLVRSRTGVRHVTDKLTVAGASPAASAGVTSTLDAGKIVLRGVVPSDAVKKDLGDQAASVVGAANVDNQLTVTAGAASPPAGLAGFLGGLAKTGVTGGSADWDGARLVLRGVVPTEAIRAKAGADAATLMGDAAKVDNQLQIAAAATTTATTPAPATTAAPVTTAAPATTAAPTTTAAPAPTTTAAPAPATTAAPPATTAAPAPATDGIRSQLELAIVYFASDSADLGPRAVATIDDVAAIMKANPSIRVGVNGNTDVRGSEEYNLELSQSRAEAVKAALVARGIDAARLPTTYIGKTRPASPTDELNRRVEFSLES